MDSIILYISAGAAVGFTIGLTGVGGGSLMTPLLLLFGFPPQVAIGTDLLYASITKTSGAIAHAKEQRVHWPILLCLAAGSLPGALLTILFLAVYGQHLHNYQDILTDTLGVMLITTAVLLLFRKRLFKHANSEQKGVVLTFMQQNRRWVTWLAGLLLGILVTLSSIGAGVLGTAVLLMLYPTLRATEVVGTELAHAVPLALIAGLGHMYLGQVDFSLLAVLLIGSLPTTYLGVIASKHIPETWMRSLLATVLMLAGVKCAFF